MFKFIGIALCTLFCALLVKPKNAAISIVLSIGGACLLLYSMINGLRDIHDGLTALIAPFPAAAGYLRLMLRVLAITLLAQFVGDICRDNGESALAGATETAAKILVITLVLPLFQTVINIVNGLIK